MSFAIPVTSQERNVAAKFLLHLPSGLAEEVEKGFGRANVRVGKRTKWYQVAPHVGMHQMSQ